MSCIGTGCKADALMQRIMAITAERDALAALLRRAFPYVVNSDVRCTQPERLVSDIEAALPTIWDRPSDAVVKDKT